MHHEAWTPDIDAAAVAMRRDGRLSAKAIAARLGRTPGAVSARLLKLGVTIHGRVEWGEEEVERLRRLLADQDMAVRAIARAMGRTECSVRWKIDDLGLVPGRLRPWTKSEDARAVAAAGRREEGLRALAGEIGRTYEALRARQVHLGIRRKATWDRASVVALRALVARGATLEEAAADLSREPKSVRSKAYALGIRFPTAANAGPAWDEEGDAILRDSVAASGTGPLGVVAAAAATGRGRRAVSVRMRELGLSRARKGKGCVAGGDVVGAHADGGSLAAAADGAAYPAPGPARPFSPSAMTQGNLSFRAGGVRGRKPSAPAGPTASDRFGMGDAIARFLSERGATRAASDPAEEVVRKVRARGYSVVRDAGGGFLVDGRHALADERDLFSFASARGMEVPEAVA